MEAIPILKNQWVVTWTLGNQQNLAHGTPTVAVTHVGMDPPPPFNSTVVYGDAANNPVIQSPAIQSPAIQSPAIQSPITQKPSAPLDASGAGGQAFFGVSVTYNVKPADKNRIHDALNKGSIRYQKITYVGPEHAKTLSNALICGLNTPIGAVKTLGLALIDAGVDLKYIGTNNKYNRRSISIVNLGNDGYTVNYPNIKRDKIAALSGYCPDQLMSYK